MYKYTDLVYTSTEILIFMARKKKKTKFILKSARQAAAEKIYRPTETTLKTSALDDTVKIPGEVPVELAPKVAEPKPFRNVKKERPTLNLKQQEFCQYLVGGMSAKDAYIKAYNYKGKNANINACYLKKRPGVAAYLEKVRESALKHDLTRGAWTREMAVDGLKEMVDAGLNSISAARAGKVPLPAVIAVTNGIKELNLMHGYNAQNAQINAKLVFFDGEDEIKD